MGSKKEFISYIKKNKTEKSIRLFFDIETLQYNQKQGRIKPSKFRNVTYSVCVGYLQNEGIQKHVFPNFKEFYETVFEACSSKSGKISCKARIELVAHNTNKYDNHFLLQDTLYYYPHVQRENIFLKNAISNEMSTKLSDLKGKESRQALILEKRVKSANNLELDIFLKGVHFKTIDNYVKTNLSIKTLGEKLLKKGLIKEEELKTDFDYLKYNLDDDMSLDEAHTYAKYVFGLLTPDEITYIENDVIILGKSVLHYSTIFPGFDYEKITFTSNILAFYKTNDLTSFQLLNEVGEGKEKTKIKYTEYNFNGENFYDYLKPFYRGGLNFYSYKYLNTIVDEDCFSIDINSSYPYSMYAFKIPTFLVDYQHYTNEQEIDILDDDYYYLYRMTKDTFNNEILLDIESKIIKQILVKYYSTNDYVNINSYTFKMIEKLTGIKYTKMKVVSTLKYETVEFGSKEQIAENYLIKSQGKESRKLIMDTPMNYHFLDEENLDMFSEEEINNAKVLLNGLYGIPALRAYFNLFKLLPDGNIENVQNGYKNTERNIVFSIFVTSVSLYNLLEPLSYLTQKEIDDNFIYCDTDSLYLKKVIFDKIPLTMYDDIALGKWGVQDELITKFFVLNHKKYAYDTPKEIKLKCGGIPLDSFCFVKDSDNKLIKRRDEKEENTYTNLSFDEFIETQFHHGATVSNLKSIANDTGTISIYDSETLIEKGSDYPLFFSHALDEARQALMARAKQDTILGLEDVMYIESEIGTFSQADLFPFRHQTKGTTDLRILTSITERIKQRIL